MRSLLRCCVPFALWTCTLPSGLAAAGFPPVSAAERALTQVPGEPGAPAVVLYEKAELRLQNYPKEVTSYFEVEVRIKILSEEGLSLAELEIPHSGYRRLTDFKGRTVLPDGTEVPLGKDAIFLQRSSKSLKRYVTKAAFPAVEVGAILDYRYRKRWESMLHIEPWFFHNRVPTLLSQITYIKPDNLALVPRSWQTDSRQIQVATERSAVGVTIRVWVENLAAMPEEPHGFSFADLSSRFMMVQKEIALPGRRMRLMESWRDTCGLFYDDYRDAQRKDRAARQQGLALAAGQPSPLAKIAAIHAFVRDEVQTEPFFGVGLPEGSSVDQVLAERRGRPMEKALLLQTMLAAVEIDAQLVWAADRGEGRIDLEVANPWWFETALVRVEVDREPLSLDPIDRSAGFARLAPYLEGMPAVLFDRKKPQTIELPQTPREDNHRRAEIRLAVEEDGRLRGTGSLTLGGHQAWRYLRWGDDPAESWREWLGERFSGYEVDEVEVEEDVREQSLRVDWTLVQRQEEVLGDEVAIIPSRPLGPTAQPFTLPAERRRTPVQLSFAWFDEMHLELTWPEGWELEAAPAALAYSSAAGSARAQVETDEARRRLRYSRRFELAQREYFGRDAYRELQELYASMEKADAQDVVLVLP